MTYKVMLLGGPLDGEWHDIPVYYLARGVVQFGVYQKLEDFKELDMVAITGQVATYRLPYPNAICLEYVVQ